MDKSKIKLLVVDDERGLCAGVQEALVREGYVVDTANDGVTALKLLGERLYNLVLSDMKMPDISGMQLLTEGKQKSRDTQFIMMTAYGTVESAVEAMKRGAFDYLSKPLNMQRLKVLVQRALEFQALVTENNELRRLEDQNTRTFTINPGMSLPEVEKLLIRQTLVYVTSNRDQAARLLGISRRTLQYKLKEYGLLNESIREPKEGAQRKTSLEPRAEQQKHRP